MDSSSILNNLVQHFNVEPYEKHLPDINSLFEYEDYAKTPLSARFQLALQTLLELQECWPEQSFNVQTLDYCINACDQQLGDVVDGILHDESFQQLESLWRSVDYLLQHTDSSNNTKIELLDMSKADCIDDFTHADTLNETCLYQHVYTDEYDTPGGEPFAAIISDYEFTTQTHDINLLKKITQISELGHAPFIANVCAQFFHKNNITEVNAIQDLEHYFQKPEFMAWNQFRNQPNARYCGLTFPKFLLRTPYDDPYTTQSFMYQESIKDIHARDYCWGSASFALAANLIKSFKEYGWCVHIQGSESGGKVTDLPLHQYNIGLGHHTKMPTQILIPESRELQLAELGLIPLSYYKNSDFACFFSANSLHKPQHYLDDTANANAKINAQLPYLLLSSRIAHYLKVVQRENIGASKDASVLEDELNHWLSTIITKMKNPSAECAARYPLANGRVSVQPLEATPGQYQVDLMIQPHYKLQGLDIQLSLTTQMPRA